MFTKIKEIKIVDETMIKKLQEEIREIRSNFASEKRIFENEMHIKINQATENKEKENSQLKEKNAVLSEKVIILEKAFENMGFDVKDMKEILNKLVEGIISKNQINVIK